MLEKYMDPILICMRILNDIKWRQTCISRQMRDSMAHCREIGMRAECMETKQESRTLVDMALICFWTVESIEQSNRQVSDWQSDHMSLVVQL